MVLRNVFRSRRSLIERLGFSPVVLGAVLCLQAHAQQLSFGGATKTPANDTNQGSPSIVYCNGQVWMYYVNHGSAPNYIYADEAPFGSPVSTGIAAYVGGLGDVGVSCSEGTTLLFYVDTGKDPRYSYGSGATFHGNYLIPTPEGFNANIVPAPANDVGGYTYFVLVGNSNYVYKYSVIPGETPVYLAETSNIAADSRPTMTVYNGVPWFGFLSGPLRTAWVGNINSCCYELPTSIEWGNSNFDGFYASIALVQYGTYLYVLGQDEVSSQYLKYTYSTNGTSWGNAVYFTSTQMRWTPSLTVDGSTIYLVYQDDSNTNISYQTGS
jgi:hypothetical protein